MTDGTEGVAPDRLSALATELRNADRAIALTGAGLSAASGIPTFRGNDGVWGDVFDEDDFHVRRFDRDPAGFWTDRLELHEHMAPEGGAQPNAAHEALAELDNAGVLDAVVTQNTDGLHAAAGTDSVIELHGNNERVVCRGCGRTTAAEPVRERVRDGERPPECDECGGVYKPDVVLFGELLPKKDLRKAKNLARASDVIVAAGSSLTVDPAASIPSYQQGGSLAVVNLESTRYSGTAEYDVQADVTEVLPALAEHVLE
ncbi:MAG: Sir2 family NAD-dependent protein deacetylase [Halopenitus sp.]